MTKVICGYCGTTDEVEVTHQHIYFPNRMVYVEGKFQPHSCKKCNEYFDVVIFGEQYVAAIWKPELYLNLGVLDNNLTYYRNEQDRLRRIENLTFSDKVRLERCNEEIRHLNNLIEKNWK